MTTDIEVTTRKYTSEPIRNMAMVFADIVGSTHLLYRAGDLALRIGTDQLLRRVSSLLAMHSGRLIKNIGDGFFAVFEEVSAAIEFSAELLQTLQRNPILVGNEKISLRMALHTGAVQLQQTSYGVDLFGEAVIVAARLTACASPGRLVVSDVAFNALPVYLQTSFESVGEFLLKGTQDKIQVYTLILTGE